MAALLVTVALAVLVQQVEVTSVYLAMLAGGAGAAGGSNFGVSGDASGGAGPGIGGIATGGSACESTGSCLTGERRQRRQLHWR